MENITSILKSKGCILLPLLCLIVASCVNYEDSITDWYFTSDEQEKWLADSTQTKFQMVDQNGITREFVLSEDDHYFLGGSSFFAGVKYQKSQREYFYQRYRSNYGDQYYFDIDASYQNDITGESMTLDLNGTSLNYDFYLNEITHLSLPDTSKSLRITSEGIEDELFQSDISFMTDYRYGDKVYPKVFHFKLKDFTDNLTSNTIVEVLYAQHSGLLYYSSYDGLVFNRMPSD